MANTWPVSPANNDTVTQGNGTTYIYSSATTSWKAQTTAGVTGGTGIDIDSDIISLDFTDPNTFLTLTKGATKEFNRTGAVLDSIDLTINGTAYFQEFNRTGSVLDTIKYYTGSDNTGTVVATKTFNRTGGVLDDITVS